VIRVTARILPKMFSFASSPKGATVRMTTRSQITLILEAQIHWRKGVVSFVRV
jgi:hypothetical protein